MQHNRQPKGEGFQFLKHQFCNRRDQAMVYGSHAFHARYEVNKLIDDYWPSKRETRVLDMLKVQSAEEARTLRSETTVSQISWFARVPSLPVVNSLPYKRLKLANEPTNWLETVRELIVVALSSELPIESLGE